MGSTDGNNYSSNKTIYKSTYTTPKSIVTDNKQEYLLTYTYT